jgi:hypothetical protein
LPGNGAIGTRIGTEATRRGSVIQRPQNIQIRLVGNVITIRGLDVQPTNREASDFWRDSEAYQVPERPTTEIVEIDGRSANEDRLTFFGPTLVKHVDLRAVRIFRIESLL